MPKFYKEPKRVTSKAVSSHQPFVDKTGQHSDYTPDELEYEDRQKCDMEDEEELPF
jgi:hypothetical protein